MSTLEKELAEVVRLFYTPFHPYLDRSRAAYKFVEAHHAEIVQNAESLREWEDFWREIEKRLRHNEFGMVGGYPEMIDQLLDRARRLRALERAMGEFDDGSPIMFVRRRADEIMREEGE